MGRVSIRFLVDADLPRAAAGVVRSAGYEATDVRDVGLSSAPDSEIAQYAKSEKLCIITGDYGFGDIRKYPPSSYYGIVVLQIPNGATAERILDILRCFMKCGDLIERLAGHLAIVDETKIRVRPSQTI